MTVKAQSRKSRDDCINHLVFSESQAPMQKQKLGLNIIEVTQLLKQESRFYPVLVQCFNSQRNCRTSCAKDRPSHVFGTKWGRAWANAGSVTPSPVVTGRALKNPVYLLIPVGCKRLPRPTVTEGRVPCKAPHQHWEQCAGTAKI